MTTKHKVLVARLRDTNDYCCPVAADVIEALTAENQTLRNAGVDLLNRAEAAEAKLAAVEAERDEWKWRSSDATTTDTLSTKGEQE